MNWMKKPWNRILKNGLVLSSTDKDADFEDYAFKDHIINSEENESRSIGGVDIMRYSTLPPFNYWVVEFWGEYRYLQHIFDEKYNVEYESMEEAQIVVDAFLDKIFDLKVFL